MTAREQTLEQALKDLRGRLTEAAEHRTQTRSAFDAIGGDDRASEAAAARQAGSARGNAGGRRSNTVRVSFRRRHAAMGHRALSARKAGATAQACRTSLRHSYGWFFQRSPGRIPDEHDRAQLAGHRPNGELVRVSGLSTGTADQLYLALRVASVEDYLDRANALPFVADDLFINFDNARAAAGFEVLRQLSRKTQVLFFTHHRHLVEIAQATLGQSVSVVSLLEEPVVSAA